VHLIFIYQHSFLQKMAFAPDDIESMLKTLKGGGGTYSVDDAACEWVKENVKLWKYWVPAEAVTVVTNTTVVEQQIRFVGTSRTASEIIGSLVTLSALVLAGFCWWRRKKDNEEYIQMSIRTLEEVQNSWNDLGDGLFTDGQTRNWEIALDEIEFAEALGQGAAGTVYRAKYNGISVAVKQLQVSQFDKHGGTMLEAQNEYRVLGSYFHPNIVRFYGVAYADEKETERASVTAQASLRAFEAGTKPDVRRRTGVKAKPLQKWATSSQGVSANIFIVLEQCKYSLKDVVYGSREKYVLDTASLFNIFEQITAGMAYLHKHEVLHRDLKPGNILIDDTNTVKIADFGTAKMNEISRETGVHRATKARLNAIQHEREMTAFVGTPVFMAPEIMTDEGTTAVYGDKADVYSLGMMMWSLWAREPPFGDEKHATMSMFALLTAVADGERPKIPKDTPPLLAFLIQDCWQSAPEERPSMEQLLQKLRTYNDHGDSEIIGRPSSRTRTSVIGALFNIGALNLTSSSAKKENGFKAVRKKSVDGSGLADVALSTAGDPNNAMSNPILMTENPIAVHDHHGSKEQETREGGSALRSDTL
jgi:serine/threonine protein kinase